MSLQVSDSASHRRDQIANFAEILKNAPSRQTIFEAVYYGKKRTKSAGEIATATGFSQKRVTMIAKRLSRERLFDQSRERIEESNQTVYRKLDFVESNKHKIMSLARSKKQREGYHTKTNPRVGVVTSVKLRVPFLPQTRFISIDDVDQFAKAKKIRTVPNKLTPERLPERTVKFGILRLLRELKFPKDWGGETNDIFSVKLRIHGRARRAAFALKGPSKKGTLSPGMMGKNGDQIQRLFNSPADVFFVQYEGEIAQSVIELMEELAKARALLSGKVHFGVINRDDTYRLRLAFPKAFQP
ncbi:MAG: hypothetical protein ACRD50_07115 [Candidatus Acidiferrales bacterium]